MKCLQYMCSMAAAGLLAASAALAADGGAMWAATAVGDDGSGRVIQQQAQGAAAVTVVGAQAARTAFLGVVTSPVSEILADQLKLAKGTGLVVDFVDAKSPAAAAGLRKNDVLVKFEDQTLVNREQLSVLVQARKPKDKVALTIIREGKEQKVTVELGEREQAAGMGLVPGQVFAVPQVLPPDAPRDARQMMAVLNGAMPRGGMAATATSSFSDGEHRLSLTTIDGEKRLVARDRDGKVLFDGPVTTDEQRKAVPPEILKKLETMEKSMRLEVRVGGQGAAHWFMQGRQAAAIAQADRPEAPPETLTDSEHRLVLTTCDGIKYLVVDNPSGAVVFQGLVQTDEQRKAVPPEILKKLETLEARIKADSHAEVSTTEGDLAVTLVAEAGRQRAIAKDAAGKVVFDGPVDTEAQRAEMPEKVRKLVEKLWKSCATIWAGSSRE